MKSESISRGISESKAHTLSQSRTITHGESFGESSSRSHTRGFSESSSHSISRAVSDGFSYGEVRSFSESSSLTDYDRAVNEYGYKVRSESVSEGTSKALSQSVSESKSSEWGAEAGVGIKGIIHAGGSYSRGTTNTSTIGTTDTEIESRTTGVQIPEGKVPSYTKGISIVDYGTKENPNLRSHTETKGEAITKTKGSTESWSEARTVSHERTKSESITEGEAISRGITKSYNETSSESRGISRGISKSKGKGQTFGESNSISQTVGRSRGYSVGEGSIYGLGIYPSISLSHTVRHIDELKRLTYELLRFERDRIAQMIAQGGYHVLCTILGDEKTITVAKALILEAYTPTRPYPEPLKAVEGDSEFLLCAKTLSFDLRPSNHIVRPYKYMNLYTATELAALTHPLRLEVPGLETVMENIPEFRVPSPKHYDIEFGNVVSHELGDVTNVRFGIDKEELLHAGFFGITRSGKTNAAMVFVSRCIKMLGAHALVLDWKRDWRNILKTVNGTLYVLYSTEPIGNAKPLKWNPLVPPKGVDPETWRDIVITWFCMTYGLGPRSYTLLWEVLDELYAERGIYDGDLSNPPTLKDMYEKISALYEAERRRRKVTFEQLDIYVKTLARLRYYTRGRLAKLYASEEHTDISELLSGVTVIEAGEMADVHKPFILGLLALSAFYYRKFNGPSEVPELIVIEEAHQVAFDPTVKEIARELNITESVFDKMAAESAGFNQYLVFIAQHPATLSNGVLKNLGLIVVFKLIAEDVRHRDIQLVKDMLVRGTERAYIEVARFITRLPVGWSIVRKCRSFELVEQEPVLVKWDLFTND